MNLSQQVNRIWNPLLYFSIILGLVVITIGLVIESQLLLYLSLGIYVLIILAAIILRQLSLPPYYYAALKKYQRGDIDSALELINKSIKSYPKSCEAYTLRSNLHLCKKALDQAKKDAHQAIQLKPDCCWGYRALGQLFYYQGHYAEAKDPFAEAVRLDPKNGLHHCTLGVIYYRLKEYEKAVDYLQTAILHLRTANSMTYSVEYLLSSHYYLGCSLDELGQEEKAGEIFDEMVKYARGVKKLEEQYKFLPDDYPAIKLGKEELTEIKELIN